MISKHTKCTADLNNDLMDQIKIKSSSMNDKRVNLLFDNVAVKKALEYYSSFNLIEGFQDIGFLTGNLLSVHKPVSYGKRVVLSTEIFKMC